MEFWEFSRLLYSSYLSFILEKLKNGVYYLVNYSLTYQKVMREDISKNIEYNINRHVEKFNKESGEIFTYRIKVKWTDADSIESDLRDNVLVIKMKDHRNQSRNFALAIREYVPKALIPTARRYVHQGLMKAIDYVISKDILAVDTNALNYFINITADDINQIKDLVEETEEINKEGRLTRILLSEYKKLSSLYPTDPKPDVHRETKEFESKVYRLAVKEPEEKVDPTYIGKYIKAAVVPIAKIETFRDFGLEAHMKFIKESLEKGVDTFLCGGSWRV